MAESSNERASGFCSVHQYPDPGQRDYTPDCPRCYPPSNPGNDLVKRLRDRARARLSGAVTRAAIAIEWQAADEIERLRDVAKSQARIASECWQRELQLRAALERWQSECTGKNGSQMDCGPMPADETSACICPPATVSDACPKCSPEETSGHQHAWSIPDTKGIQECAFCGAEKTSV